jgi:hypothetical protein
MDPRAQTALYVAAACGLIGGFLWFYGSSFKHAAWSLFFGVLVFTVIYFVGYTWLFAGTK